jgi:hypothetical protein
VNVPVTVATATISSAFLPFSASEQATVSGDVARFSTENALAMPSDFSATIRWGDGSVTSGQIIAIAPMIFDVNASHIYTTSGTFPVSVTVQSVDKVQSSTSGTVTVADRLVPVVGGLQSGSDTGISSSDGITHTNQPVYAGTAEVGDIVTLTGKRPDMAAPVVIGQVTAGSDGSWKVTTSPLVDGTYAISVSAADAAGHVSSPSQSLPSLIVDTVGPRITGVVLDPKTGTVKISVQDDRSGFSDSTLLNSANYSLTSTAAGSKPATITGVTVSPGGATDTRVITLNVSLNAGKKKAAKAGKYVLSINGENLSDIAGNALDERFFTLPSPAAKGAYIAQLITDGRANAGPSVVTSQATPKPPKAHFKARRHH